MMRKTEGEQQRNNSVCFERALLKCCTHELKAPANSFSNDSHTIRPLVTLYYGLYTSIFQ